MIGHGSLIRSFGKNFRRDLLKICVEPSVSSFRGKAAQLGQLLCSTDGLNKLVKNLLGGGRRVGSPRKHLNSIRIFRRRSPVLLGETRRDLGALEAAMAGITGHHPHSTEVGPIDEVLHQNHPARSLFKRSVVGIPIPIAGAFRDVAVRAIHAQGSGEETHRPHEFVHGNPPEHLDVFEGFFRHLRLLIRARLGGLAACPSGPQEAHDHGSHGAMDRSTGLKLHLASFSRRARRARSRLAIEADRSLRGLVRRFIRPRTSICRITPFGSARRHYTLARFRTQWKGGCALWLKFWRLIPVVNEPESQGGSHIPIISYQNEAFCQSRLALSVLCARLVSTNPQVLGTIAPPTY